MSSLPKQVPQSEPTQAQERSPSNTSLIALIPGQSSNKKSRPTRVGISFSFLFSVDDVVVFLWLVGAKVIEAKRNRSSCGSEDDIKDEDDEANAWDAVEDEEDQTAGIRGFVLNKDHKTVDEGEPEEDGEDDFDDLVQRVIPLDVRIHKIPR